MLLELVHWIAYSVELTLWAFMGIGAFATGQFVRSKTAKLLAKLWGQ